MLWLPAASFWKVTVTGVAADRVMFDASTPLSRFEAGFATPALSLL